MTKSWRSFLLVVSLGVGCGGGDGDASIPSSGVEGSKVASKLTQDENARLCTWDIDLENMLIDELTPEQFCTLNALETRDPAKCKSQRADCMAELQRGAEEDAEAWCKIADNAFQQPSCGATVAQLERCVVDLYEANLALAKSTTCDNAATWEPLRAKSCDEGNVERDCLRFADDAE